MKKLFLVVATLLSANVFALSSDYKLVPANETTATNLCLIAAQDGISAAKRTARTAGVRSVIEFNATECNGQNIRRFAAKFKQVDAQAQPVEQTNTTYVFKAKDSATPSLVCKIAAEQGLQEALKVGGADSSRYICNGLNIKRFARRYNKA